MKDNIKKLEKIEFIVLYLLYYLDVVLLKY